MTAYRSWLKTPSVRLPLEEFGRQPLYFTLQEHFCCDPAARVPQDDVLNGIRNAWLPSDCRWEVHEVYSTEYTIISTLSP